MVNTSAQVMLNEIINNGPGMDAANSMITELYGPPGTVLTGWMLVGLMAIVVWSIAPLSYNGAL